jgi:hypothetical protein
MGKPLSMASSPVLASTQKALELGASALTLEDGQSATIGTWKSKGEELGEELMRETQQTMNGGRDESKGALGHAIHACQYAPTMFRLVL